MPPLDGLSRLNLGDDVSADALPGAIAAGQWSNASIVFDLD
jgi:hypothetical protein